MQEEQKGSDKFEVFSNEKDLKLIWKIATIVGLIAGIGGATFLWLVKFEALPKDAVWPKVITALIVTGWTLIPPAWFSLEYTFLITNEDKETKPKRMARYKEGRDLAKAAWLAFGLLIVSTLFGGKV